MRSSCKESDRRSETAAQAEARTAVGFTEGLPAELEILADLEAISDPDP